MKHAHTAGDWRDDWNEGRGISGPTTATSGGPCCERDRKYHPVSVGAMTVAMVPLPEGEDETEMVANAALIALAPTAPHDCDIPGPGAENKRKLEAAGELLELLSEAAIWAQEQNMHFPSSVTLDLARRLRARVRESE